MSQRHATTVHRFVVDGTIEEAILGLLGQVRVRVS
jgi:SNF2 family DNA or RNA helicase